MTTAQKLRLSVGCIFFISALTAWFLALHSIHKYRWTVLEQPVSIEEGFVLEHSFTVDTAADYYVEIECRKTIPFETLNSLLTDHLLISYSVTENGNQIADGDSRTQQGGAYAQDYITRAIGKLHAEPGHAYKLTLRVAHTLPELAVTSPVAKVSVTPLVYKDAAVWAGLTFYLSVGLAIVAVICILPVFYSLLVRRDNNNRNT
jgi:hypothetical protein